jgi:hypothetical protein
MRVSQPYRPERRLIQRHRHHQVDPIPVHAQPEAPHPAGGEPGVEPVGQAKHGRDIGHFIENGTG